MQQEIFGLNGREEILGTKEAEQASQSRFKSKEQLFAGADGTMCQKCYNSFKETLLPQRCTCQDEAY